MQVLLIFFFSFQTVFFKAVKRCRSCDRDERPPATDQTGAAPPRLGWVRGTGAPPPPCPPVDRINQDICSFVHSNMRGHRYFMPLKIGKKNEVEIFKKQSSSWSPYLAKGILGWLLS